MHLCKIAALALPLRDDISSTQSEEPDSPERPLLPLVTYLIPEKEDLDGPSGLVPKR